MIIHIFVARAFGQSTVGSSEVVWDYNSDNSSYSVVNASITADFDDVWIAVEWADVTINNGAHRNLDLWWNPGSAWNRRYLSSNELTGGSAGHYPTITTWPGHDYVYVVGKQDYLTAEAQYKFFRQDRDDMYASTSTSTLGSVGSSIEHGRAFLNYDYDWWSFDATEAQYLCWTQRDVSTCSPGPCDDDVQLKAKLPTNTWPSASVNDLESNAGDTDDHCTMDFDHDGYMYSAFHTDVSGSDQIKFELEDYNPSGSNWATFTPSGGILPLPSGHTGADFPTLSVAPVWNGFAWVSRIFIVAQSSNNQDDLLWWTCEGDKVDCDQVSEWSYGATDVGGAVTRQPMVASIPIYGHSFVLYELANGDIAVAEWCDGDSDWSDVGVVPRPATYSRDLAFGWKAGSAVPTVAWNAVTTLHAVFLGEEGNTNRVNPIHWSAEIGTDLCP